MAEVTLYLDRMDRDTEARLDEQLEAIVAESPAREHTLSPEGVTWREYFARYEARLAAARAPEVIESDAQQDETVVIEAGRDLDDPLKAPATPGRLAKRLAARGYDVRVSRSLVRMPAKRRLKATEEHAAGAILHPAYNLETFVLVATWRGPEVEQLVALDVTWERRHADTAPPLAHKPGSLSFKGAQTFDPALGYEIRVGAAKPRKQNEIEAEDGIEPPLGLNQWLDLVCPKS